MSIRKGAVIRLDKKRLESALFSLVHKDVCQSPCLSIHLALCLREPQDCVVITFTHIFKHILQDEVHKMDIQELWKITKHYRKINDFAEMQENLSHQESQHNHEATNYLDLPVKRSFQ
nr:uncharacterized protein LOC128694716 [Cherax quadricarinatus]